MTTAAAFSEVQLLDTAANELGTYPVAWTERGSARLCAPADHISRAALIMARDEAGRITLVLFRRCYMEDRFDVLKAEAETVAKLLEPIDRELACERAAMRERLEALGLSANQIDQLTARVDRLHAEAMADARRKGEQLIALLSAPPDGELH